MNDIFDEDMKGKKVYLFTGGIQPIKGALQVLTAFVNEIKDTDARLLCLGLNPQVETESLRGKVKFLLTKIGYYTYNWKVKRLIERDNRIKVIHSIYMLADIMQQCFCNLSYFTIPHANLAMAEAEIMGLPSVAALNEEALEYSLNGQCAELYESNNYSSFVKAIKNMCDNYESYKSIIKEKAQIIANKFDKESNIILLQRTLSSVIEK